MTYTRGVIRSESVVWLTLALVAAVAFAFQSSPGRIGSRVSDAFSQGWILADTNEDGIVDFVAGKVVVPAHPSAAENAAAANVAGRLGYESTGLTPPVVITTANEATPGPRIWVGRDAIPSALSTEGQFFLGRLEKLEGGTFALGGNLAILANDEEGLVFAAEAYAARSPYQWRVPGERLSAIPQIIRTETGANAELVGVTYLSGKAGVHRAYVNLDRLVSSEALDRLLALPELAAVHELIARVQSTLISAVSPRAEGSQPEPSSTAMGPQAPENVPQAAGGVTQRLDLATLFTAHGLFSGSPRMPVPSALSAHLYVPGGAAGVAMANFAARMGLETTGISLPLATPANGTSVAELPTQAVIVGDSVLAQKTRETLHAQDTAAESAETKLDPGEGEVRVVDDTSARHGAVLALGDERGATAALDLVSGHFPNLWEYGKQYLSLEEIRYDLHRFFSVHSAVGQATAGLFHLDRWLKGIDPAGVHDVSAELYVDVADPHLEDFIRQEVERRLNVKHVEVRTGSLRAGTRCCAENPPLHYGAPGFVFRQAAPTFAEDFVIPWEGRRLIDAVTKSSAKITRGQPVRLVARVSEGPKQRKQLEAQLQEIVRKAGADLTRSKVEVLCAYKQGYSWLMDEIAPALAGKAVASMKIEFAKNVDPTGMRSMLSEDRWVAELFPVDEMLARQLGLPLDKIALDQMEPVSPAGPTYRVRAYDAGGREILTSDFTVATVLQPYINLIPAYEQVQVDTGWVRMECESKILLDQRIKTDLEEFWSLYQTQTLPKIYEFVMMQAHGELRQEYAPLFDTLKLDIHLSEPDYDLPLDKERISSLEALQEDTFYTTENFLNLVGDVKTGHPVNYIGRVIPIVHGAEDGKDGHVRVEFYGKPAANPLVRLNWTDAQNRRHEQERELPALSGEIQPRLIQARVKAGTPGVERLMWLLSADYLRYEHDEWIKMELEDHVDRNIFSVEQAQGQLHWLERLHQALLYGDDIAYPHLHEMAVEFELPLAVAAKIDSPAQRVFVSWAVPDPVTPRPMISDYKKIDTAPIVQWNEPISPEENARILAKLATFPGVNVYWMGRSYLGQDLWAADLLLPTPATMRSWAKETTLKAVIVYSGRQHANEVSSTSHIDKLGEELLTDPEKRALLKKVNVVLHPITNPDGAQLSMDLMSITPDNLLHPGYHGSLAADVSMGATEVDPIYPESRTRKQLIDMWLPDAFLNPHGYPSHEWVQPFSEYMAYVGGRQTLGARQVWIPRGWYTTLGYQPAAVQPYSKQIAYALQDRIVAAERNVPGLLPLEARMIARYERYGMRWQTHNMFLHVVDGICMFMSLKGGAQVAGGVTGLSPFITWDTGYTEAPDETAHGDYLKLMASTGLAFDYAHLKYMVDGDLRITHTEREEPGGVQRRVERIRPILPPGTGRAYSPTAK